MSLFVERGRAGRLAGELPERRALVMLVLAQQLTGLLLGLIWLAWAPSSVSYLLDIGNGTGAVVPAPTEAQVAGDGRYAMLTALAGLLFGLIGWRMRGNRGPVTLVVLAASSLLGSLLALATGQLLSTGQHASALNTAFHPSLVLHGTALVFLQALIAVLAYTVCAGLSSDRELGRSQDSPPGEPLGPDGKANPSGEASPGREASPSDEANPDGEANPGGEARPSGEPGPADVSRQPDGELRSGG
jgi:hypothetical protein